MSAYMCIFCILKVKSDIREITQAKLINRKGQKYYLNGLFEMF